MDDRSNAGQRSWAAGAAGGLLGGLAMGVILQLTTETLPLIGSVYGMPTVLGGWIAHLAHAVLFGLLFVWIVTLPLFRDTAQTLIGSTGIGIGYGAVLGLGVGGMLLPIAIALLGQSSLPVPSEDFFGIENAFTLAFAISVAHFTYGGVLGLTYWKLRSGTTGETKDRHSAAVDKRTPQEGDNRSPRETEQ